LYKRKPERYNHIDVGDISKQLEVKKRLQCKPFKFFLEEIAPDMLEKYPPTQTEFAIGSVRDVSKGIFRSQTDVFSSILDRECRFSEPLH
jgi:polypeptide N-acetylgalactosaminyltransferase